MQGRFQKRKRFSIYISCHINNKNTNELVLTHLLIQYLYCKKYLVNIISRISKTNLNKNGWPTTVLLEMERFPDQHGCQLQTPQVYSIFSWLPGFRIFRLIWLKALNILKYIEFMVAKVLNLDLMIFRLTKLPASLRFQLNSWLPTLLSSINLI